MSKFCFSKKGFGLIEVMAAAVVLGFLIVGLTRLQMGNRESIIRVRARDAANFVAQHVLDSIGSMGINSIVAEGPDNNTVYEEEEYEYSFEGKNTGQIKVTYTVKVLLLDADEDIKSTIDSTDFTKANRGDPDDLSGEKNVYSKNLEAEVSWEFKGSPQSIKMAKVVR